MTSRMSRRGQTPVWAATISRPGDGAPLALGMLQSALDSHDEGSLRQRIRQMPIALDSNTLLAQVDQAGCPGILLMSNYFWTVDANLAAARSLKARSPTSITVFGGPSAPKYESEAERFLRDNPEVNVLVRGEGEATIGPMISILADTGGSIEALSETPGLSFLNEGVFIRTNDPVRMTDLNSVPSPYLSGRFDHLVSIGGIWAVESNRGCPYACTFCDWGAATQSRIRKFDLDRVRAEFDWLADHGIVTVFMADSNFGIFERDTEIVEHVASLYGARGSPSSFIASFAKNTTKHTIPIIDTLVAAGLMGEGTISFQTTDPETLRHVRRSNIKLEAYDKLADEMRRRQLPILADIMIGLPGSNFSKLKDDLQLCIQGEVMARVFPTFVLPNSPMNDPAYREEFSLGIDSNGQLVSSSSYSSAEWDEMVRFVDIFRISEHFGVLRHLVRYVARVVEDREVDVLERIHLAAQAEPDRYPAVAFFLLAARRYLSAPLSWGTFYDEIGRLCRAQFDLQPDAGFATALEVQRRLMPDPTTSYPLSVELDHDYVAFYRDQIRPSSDAPPSGRPLTDYPPAVLAVDDPGGLSKADVPQPWKPLYSPEGNRFVNAQGSWSDETNWELDSELSRALRSFYV